MCPSQVVELDKTKTRDGWLVACLAGVEGVGGGGEKLGGVVLEREEKAPFLLSLLLFFSSSPPLFLPAPQASHFVGEHKTAGSVSCGILPWACFGDAITSFIEYYSVA